MAIFPQYTNLAGGEYGKTHTKLELSNGQAPAEKFVVSKDNEFDSFIYEYGPAGHQTVLIPKGKLVEAAGTEFNPSTGFHETAIKVAGEGSNRVLGVNQHNIYETRRGAMEGTSATVLGRSYIEVPLFEAEGENEAARNSAAGTAAAMKFGAAYGAKNELQPGDFVVAGADGNFRRYNGLDEGGTDKPEQIIGRVWGATRDLPPAGALQYYTGLSGDALKEAIDALSNYSGAGDEAKPGHPYSNGAWLPEFLRTIGTGEMKGIPFLTDGYFSAKERKDVTLVEAGNEDLEQVRVQDAVKYNETDGSLEVSDETEEEAMAIVKLKHQIDPLETGDIKVTAKINDATEATELSKRDVHVDLSSNAVVLYLEAGKKYTDVTIGADLVVNPRAGIPTEWDHKGSVGAVRILLNQ